MNRPPAVRASRGRRNRVGGDILSRFLNSRDIVYDLGSSTGTTLIKVSEKLSKMDLRYVGVDGSEAMIKKSRSRVKMFSHTSGIDFVLSDINDFETKDAGAVILNYTLQFLRPVIRESFLKKVHGFLREKGVLVMSEKVISHDPVINRAFIDFYINFKKSMGYSDLEIAKKREALENVLIPFSVSENIELLKKVGFVHVEPFFQWFNFVSILAVKG